VYNVEFFAEELGLIKLDTLRDMTEVALSRAPEYFWSIPASLTGKHHPPDDLQDGGLCIHEKKVAWIAYRLFDAFFEDTDIAISAALLHDIHHRGDKDGEIDDEAYPTHAADTAAYLRKWGYEEFSYLPYTEELAGKWARVCDCIHSHMGRYEGRSAPVGLAQQLFHCADVAASFRLLVGLAFYTSDLPPLPDIMDAGKHLIQRDGEWIINFGKKHYRKKVFDVMKTDPGYFDWMRKAGFPADVLEQLKALRKEYGDKIRIESQLRSGNLPFG